MAKARQQPVPELGSSAGDPEIAPTRLAPDTAETLKEIFQLIQDAGGVDFNLYKPATIRRRIARRMRYRKTNSLTGYLQLLRSDREEIARLYGDLLITVTEFFRDPDTFDTLKDQLIPRILENVPRGSPARVWVPGCASGEEAYSIAICFVEAATDRAWPPVRIFATDVSQECIDKARRAVFAKRHTANISPDRLRRFFVKETDGYKVNSVIRDLCIFAKQDVTRDPPFSYMDLVSCRNLLIYLDMPGQKQVLHHLHYALKPTGFLLLGAAESPTAAPYLFRSARKRHRIYSKVLVGAPTGLRQ